MLERGLVQLYTGDGKGKTTAALGLALRAAGRGNRVLVYQFLKPASLALGERAAIERSGLAIRIEALDADWDVSRPPRSEQDLAKVKVIVQEALARLAETAAQAAYDVLILDEIVFCLAQGLARFEDVRRIVERKGRGVELVLTGRGATAEMIALADLVTEMKSVKHPFDQGVRARPGIDY
jgi:cob(I)alamin adenosyltransferase